MEICKFFSYWSVAVLCCFLYLTHLGPRMIAGLMFVTFIERFDASREQSAFSMLFGGAVNMISGPVVGYLGTKFGIKNVIICGCLLTSFSMTSCFFAEDITFVTMFFGIQGISIALVMHLIPSLLHFHFKKNEGMANGIALVGPCLGGVIFSPFYKFLLNTYGASGAFLIMGSVILHSVPASMLLRILARNCDASEGERKKKDNLQIFSVNTANKTSSLLSSSSEEITSSKYSSAMSRNASNIVEPSKTETELKELSEFIESDSHIGNANTSIVTKNSSLNINFENVTDEHSLNHVNSIVIKDGQNQMNNSNMAPTSDVLTEKKTCNSDLIQNDSLFKQKTVLKEVVFVSADSNDLQNGPTVKISSGNTSKYVPRNDDADMSNNTDKNTNCPSTSDVVDKANNTCSSKNISLTEKGNISTKDKETAKPKNPTKLFCNLFKVLLEPTFFLVSFAVSSHLFIMMVVHTVMVDFALEKGFSVDQGVYMLMCLNLADMIGRFGLGWVTDGGRVSVTNFAAFFYIFTALCHTLFALTTDFVLVMSSLGFASFAMGALMTVFPVMISKYFPDERNVMAQASRYIVVVPAILIISPLIRFFKETLGSYKLLFYFLDIVCILCSIIILLLPTLAEKKK